MADVFISYAQDDVAYRDKVQAALVRAGYTTWSDQSLRPDQYSYRKQIDRELKAARAVAVLWTERAVASDWVDREAGYGLDTGKLVPLWLETCELEAAYRDCQTADLTNWDGRDNDPKWAIALGWIRNLAGAPAAQAVPPPRGPMGGRTVELRIPREPIAATIGAAAALLIIAVIVLALRLGAPVASTKAGPGATLAVSIVSLDDSDRVVPVQTVEGFVSDLDAELWPVVHPIADDTYWVQQQASVSRDGRWHASVRFGGQPGDAFELRVVADPEQPLERGDRLPTWPAGEAASAIVSGLVRE